MRPTTRGPGLAYIHINTHACVHTYTHVLTFAYILAHIELWGWRGGSMFEHLLLLQRSQDQF